MDLNGEKKGEEEILEELDNSTTEQGTGKNDVEDILEDLTGDLDDSGVGTHAPKGGEGKGNWTTTLPKSLREGIDTERYGSLEEYILALRKGQMPAAESDSEWEKLGTRLKEGTDGLLDVEGSIKTMKEAGVTTKQAESIISRLVEEARDAVGAKSIELRNAVSDLLVNESKRLRGGKDEVNSIVKKGIAILKNEDPELFVKGKKDAILLHPTSVRMLYMLGRQAKEEPTPKSNVAGDTRKRGAGDGIGFPEIRI